MPKPKQKSAAIVRGLRAFIETQVRKAGGLELPGAEKFAHVKGEVIEWLDNEIALKNPIAEWLSDIAIRGGVNIGAFLIEGMIEEAVEDGRAAGLIK